MTTSILQPTRIDPQDRQQALFPLLLPGSNRKQASRFEAFAAQREQGQGGGTCSLSAPTPWRSMARHESPTYRAGDVTHRVAPGRSESEP